MDTILMNSENGKTSQPNFTDEIDLGRGEKKHCFIKSNLLNIYYTWKNIEKPYKNNKFKISAPI